MHTGCSACGRGVLVFEGDLGTCDRCDARFQRTTTPLGEGVLRRWQHEELAIVLDPAPARLECTREGRRTILTIRGNPTARVMGGLLLFAAAAVLFAGPSGWGRILVAAALFALLGAVLVLRERVVVDADRIEQCRVYPDRIALPGRVEISLGERTEGKKARRVHYVRVRSPRGELVVGKHDSLTLAEASWLADALRKAIHDAGRR